MKKLLSILGSVTLIVSGVGTTTLINIENNNNLLTTNNQQDLQLLMSDVSNIYVAENWKTNAEGPRTTLEKIGGVWRLEFNHELTQDIVSGSVKASDILDTIAAAVDKIPGLGKKLGSISEIINAILKLGKSVLAKADEGNGILIRFGGWVLPTKITTSTHTWN